MPPFAGLAIFLAVDIEPFVGARIPRGLGDLQASARKRHEHLAQRTGGEHALDGENFIRAVQPDGDDFVAPGLFAKGSLLRFMLERARRHERRVLGRRRRRALSQRVMRAGPRSKLLRMTVTAAR